MDHAEYARQVLDALGQPPAGLPPFTLDEARRNNAARCMAAFLCHRLAQRDTAPEHLRFAMFHWNGGTVVQRNSRVTDHHWSNATPSIVEQIHTMAADQPVAYLLTYWEVDEGVLHAWAVPEDVAYQAFAMLPVTEQTRRKVVQLFPSDHRLRNAPSAPSFAPYYLRTALTDAELEKLQEAIKTDDLIKQERLAEDESTQTSSGENDETEPDDTASEIGAFYTEDTVAYLLELPNHVQDSAWHETNKRRYWSLLRDPSRRLVESLRTRYIQQLSSAVAGGKRPLSILKKNDYGKGAYHDHYWFAFYDPQAGSKTRSVQLFVRFLGRERVWRYGFSMGDYCGEYLQRLRKALLADRHAVAEYVRDAPPDTIVRLAGVGTTSEFSHAEFADRLLNAGDAILGADAVLDNILIIREYPLETLPQHADNMVDEIGLYFRWAWPFFEASITGEWKLATRMPPPTDEDDVVDVDETAPQSIAELAELTAMPEEFLAELEDALWAKQQAVLVGPPGTSKTYIARQFARYFVRQRRARPQGTFEVLYMHANWTYEDFFEGIKPVSRNSSLSFEPRLGFFLEWIERLKEYGPRALHVLILDEINRCDTAAVLGELLQLLEYRGSTVRLMSGRSFVFPPNVFIIGTMNSADRSIGRMDLALQRRFFQILLHPRVEVLDRWLKRPGNNPLRFRASALARCNELLAEHGIPPEQQIGHALFMLQRTAEDEEASPKLDKPLSAKRLTQIVRFSVVPYVRELLTMQFGRADENLLSQISDLLLACVNAQSRGESSHAFHADA